MKQYVCYLVHLWPYWVVKLNAYACSSPANASPSVDTLFPVDPWRPVPVLRSSHQNFPCKLFIQLYMKCIAAQTGRWLPLAGMWVVIIMHLDNNIGGVDNFVKLAPNSFALTFVKHSVSSCIPRTIVFNCLAQNRLWLIIIITICNDPPHWNQYRSPTLLSFVAMKLLFAQYISPQNKIRYLALDQPSPPELRSLQLPVLIAVFSFSVQRCPQKSLCPISELFFAAWWEQITQ